ncbi:MAG: transposase [Actinomycetota bacterium]|nr:transposase [Actinomycetota bacterium]
MSKRSGGVPRGRGSGRPESSCWVTLEQIAADFGMHPMTLSKWLRKADVEDGVKPGDTVAEAAENRELRRRNKQLEQEVEILRRATAYFARDTLPKLVWSWRKTERQR